MTRKEIAMENFGKGYNCSQSVVLAFSDLLGLPDDVLAKLASSFGGGMGRMREVCGAVSGMSIVLGLLYGYDNPQAVTEKSAHYERIQNAAKAFEDENGSYICRKLLNLPEGPDSPVPEKRTDEYYRKRPCKELVGSAAEILDRIIKEDC